MEIYLVGGAVRDRLLGLPPGDRDHVVVGATPEAMLAAGFRQVGRDFPVFLHPDTDEEYALARTERKSGHGYRGFVVHAGEDVTLQDDLRRRDFTINAIAEDADGTCIDPWGGVRDLEARVLGDLATDPVEPLADALATLGIDLESTADDLDLHGGLLSVAFGPRILMHSGADRNRPQRGGTAAIATARTTSEPARRSARAQASSVAPVVNTSSTITT